MKLFRVFGMQYTFHFVKSEGHAQFSHLNGKRNWPGTIIHTAAQQSITYGLYVHAHIAEPLVLLSHSFVANPGINLPRHLRLCILLYALFVFTVELLR